MSAAPVLRAPERLRVRVGFELRYALEYPTPMLFVVEPQDRPFQQVIEARRRVLPEPAPGRMHSYTDLFGNRVWRLLAAPGPLLVSHDAVLDVVPHPDPDVRHLPKHPVEALPDHALHYLLPSRYADSDRLAAEAWDRFGSFGGGEQVQAVCDHLHASLPYRAGSDSGTSATEAYRAGAAVCRDFAHLGVAFCRALNVPARYACGYLGDIDVPPDERPMDFHAWFEAYLGGEWRTFDARHNTPRAGRVLIATGRDAADVAFATTFGDAPLLSMRVWADETGPHAGLPPVAVSPAGMETP